MKKNLILILLFLLVIPLYVGCKTNEENYDVASISEESIELEIGRIYTINVNTEVMDSLTFTLENDKLASIEIENNALKIEANDTGITKLNVIYKEKIIDSVTLNIIEEVIFLPIPTGKILLKGVDKEASVKIILTKDGLDLNSATWEIDNSDVVSMEYQGGIAHFHSLARGKATVTVRVGDYDNTFEIYVTNIRGDID